MVSIARMCLMANYTASKNNVKYLCPILLFTSFETRGKRRAKLFPLQCFSVPIRNSSISLFYIRNSFDKSSVRFNLNANIWPTFFYTVFRCTLHSNASYIRISRNSGYSLRQPYFRLHQLSELQKRLLNNTVAMADTIIVKHWFDRSYIQQFSNNFHE